MIIMTCRNVALTAMSGGWLLINGADQEQMEAEGEEVIADICLLARKEKVPSGFTVLEQTIDGKKADFAEGGMFSSTRRYLAFTRKAPSAIRGWIVLVDLKVLNAADRPPLGFLPLTHTQDDNTKAFSSKVLAMKMGAHSQTTRAITDLQVLTAARKEDVPAGYARLPDINGFSICYKVGDVSKRRSSQSQIQSAAATSVPAKEKHLVHQPAISKKYTPAVEGLQFKLGAMMDTKHYLVEHAIGDLKLLSLDDVDKFKMDFSKFQEVASTT